MKPVGQCSSSDDRTECQDQEHDGAYEPWAEADRGSQSEYLNWGLGSRSGLPLVVLSWTQAWHWQALGRARAVPGPHACHWH